MICNIGNLKVEESNIWCSLTNLLKYESSFQLWVLTIFPCIISHEINQLKSIIYLFGLVGLDEKETRKVHQKQVQRSRVKPSTSDATEVCFVQS